MNQGEPVTRCPIESIWQQLGRRHALHIIKTMETQEFFRFSELKLLIPEISGTVLSERLDELETLDLIQKQEDGDSRIKYSLTKKSLEFKPIIDSMIAWVEKWNQQIQNPEAHAIPWK